MDYGPTNLRNSFYIIDTVNWIDTIPPTFTIVPAVNGFGVMIFYSDNNPGVTAFINGYPYAN